MAFIREINPPQGLIYKNENIQLKIGEKVLESGILYITEDSLSWKPQSRNEGISIPWKQISLHGISSSPSKYVYVMLDHKLQWEGVYDPGSHNSSNMNGSVGGGGGNASNNENGADGDGINQQQQNNDNDSDNDEGNESDCEQDFTELWLIPSDTNCVEDIFQAMKECQALHPDSADSISDEGNFMDAQDIDDDDNDDPDDDDEIGQNDMKHLNINDEKFADAED